MNRAEIQALIDARGEVTLPHAIHYLDGPLVMRSGARLSLGGGYLVNVYDDGGPLIVTPGEDQATLWGVRHGRLIDGGIELRPAAIAPNFFELHNLTIAKESRSVRCAFDARGCGGAWMGQLSLVQVVGCVEGFRQVDGTTMTFTNCFANRCTGKAWDLDNVYAASLRSCAADNNVGPAVRFAACDALTIAGWYGEANEINGCTHLLVDACQGVIDGLVSLGSRLHADPGFGATWLQVNASRLRASGLVLGGSPKRNPDAASGPGLSQLLLISGGSTISLSASQIHHADRAVGAGPAYAVNGAYTDNGSNTIGGAA